MRITRDVAPRGAIALRNAQSLAFLRLNFTLFALQAPSAAVPSTTSAVVRSSAGLVEIDGTLDARVSPSGIRRLRRP